MMAFLSNKWIHVLIVAVVAALPAALQTAGIPPSPMIDAMMALLAGSVGAHAGLTHIQST